MSCGQLLTGVRPGLVRMTPRRHFSEAISKKGRISSFLQHDLAVAEKRSLAVKWQADYQDELKFERLPTPSDLRHDFGLHTSHVTTGDQFQRLLTFSRAYKGYSMMLTFNADHDDSAQGSDDSDTEEGAADDSDVVSISSTHSFVVRLQQLSVKGDANRLVLGCYASPEGELFVESLSFGDEAGHGRGVLYWDALSGDVQDHLDEFFKGLQVDDRLAVFAQQYAASTRNADKVANMKKLQGFFDSYTWQESQP